MLSWVLMGVRARREIHVDGRLMMLQGYSRELMDFELTLGGKCYSNITSIQVAGKKHGGDAEGERYVLNSHADQH